MCSYLLIGFWYKDPANGRAARKAFIVTRIGDTAFAVGLFLLFTHLGTLHIQELMRNAANNGRWDHPWRLRRARCSWVGRWANRLKSLCKHGCPTQWRVRLPLAP